MNTNDRFTRSLLLSALLLFLVLACGENNTNKESSDNISKLIGSKDSTSSPQNLEADKVKIDEMKANMDEIRDTINILENNAMAIEDSLNAYTSILTEINIKIDDLQKKKSYVSETKDKNMNKVTTNIADLEALVNSLKISKSNKEDELKLIEKKKELITKKNEALKTELEYQKTELKEYYSQQNSQDKIKEVNESIVKISSEIAENDNQLLEEELNQKLLKNKIASIETDIKTNQSNFKTEYEKSTGLDDYVKEERMALDSQIKNLEQLKSVNSDKWKSFKQEKENIEEMINQFKIEMSEISLNSDTEIKLSQNTSKNETKTKDNSEINDNKNTKISEINEELNEPEDSSSSLIYWILLIVVVLISVLYFVGKNNKTEKENLE